MSTTLIQLLKAGIAITFAMLAVIVVGAFLMTPQNPAQFREVQEKYDLALEQGMTFRAGEAEEFFVPSRSAETAAPPYVIAILDWHAILFVPFSALAVLLFRPRFIYLLILVVPTSLVFSLLAGIIPAVYFAGSILAAGIILQLYRWAVLSSTRAAA